MIFKTLLLAATLAFASENEKITIKMVKTERSKDSSTETTLYEITPVSLAYTYTRTGRKEAKKTQSAYLSKKEWAEIRYKYIEFNLNQDIKDLTGEGEMSSMELTTSAKLDSVTNTRTATSISVSTSIQVSGKPDDVKSNAHYKKTMKFIDWLELFKPL